MRTILASISTITAVALLAGCETPPGPATTSGAVMGGATGALAGGIIGNQSRHAAGGALIGGAIGALAGALIGKDVDDHTRVRVVQGQPLTIEDIKILSHANISDDLIISQINATRTVYHLTSAQIIDLKQFGVSQKVMDYMINTPILFTEPPPDYRYYRYEPAPYYWHYY